MMQLFQKGRQRLAQTDPIYLCLFLAMGLVFLLISFCGISYYYLNNYTMIPVMLFWGILLTRKPDKQACIHLLGGFLVSLWFVASQSLLYASGMGVRSPGIFFMVYLLAFPFASASRDKDAQTGLKLAGFFYIAGALMLAMYTGLLALDALPGFLKPHVIWDGARLNPFWQPNICACIMMIALAFCLYFFTTQTKRLYKGIFVAISAVLLLIIALTNSRTGMLLSACLVAGFLFFNIWNSGWKRFLLAGLAAAVTVAALFLCLQGIFSLHSQHKLQQAIVQQSSAAAESAEDPLTTDKKTGEVTLDTHSAQSTLANDMVTLNSRSNIWKAAIQAVKKNPIVLLRGSDSSGDLLWSTRKTRAMHCHNSWLEALLTLGIPGLIAAGIFTVVALWNIVAVMFFRNCTLEKKVLAMLILCLLIAGVMEPYLFTGSINFLYADFVFFLGLGYLTQWKKTA